MDGISRPQSTIKSLTSDWTSRITVPILVIEISLVMVLSFKAVSSEIEEYDIKILVPVLIPIVWWWIVARIRKGVDSKYLISYLPQLSILSLFTGIFFISIFFLNEDSLFFEPGYWLCIFSTSTMLMAVSEDMDDSGFDWIDLVSTLMAGNEVNKAKALVPIVQEERLEYRTSSNILRRNVEVDLLPGIHPIEVRTRELGYILRVADGSQDDHGEGVWSPATVNGLYQLMGRMGTRGFSIGAAKKMEMNSLCYLMLASLSDSDSRWDQSKLRNLKNGGQMNYPIGDQGEVITISHRWSEEDIAKVSKVIVESLSKISKKSNIVESMVNKAKKGKKFRLFDFNKDGKRDFGDVKYAATRILDWDGDGDLDIDDLKILFWGPSPLEEGNSIHDCTDTLLHNGGGEASKISLHLMLSYLICLSSYEIMTQNSISPIAWREMCNFFTEMAKEVSDKVAGGESPEGEDAIIGDANVDSELGDSNSKLAKEYQSILIEASKRPVQEFADKYDMLLKSLKRKSIGEGSRKISQRFDLLLGSITSRMIDRTEVEPYGITTQELLEKRRGAVIAATLIVGVLGRYREYFKEGNE